MGNLIHSGFRWRLLPTLFPALLVIAGLYYRAMGFAFFNDDPTGHFAWMESRSIWQFFTSSAEYGYYRPMVFASLRILEWLFGTSQIPHSPIAGHGLLLLLHTVNTAMVWRLAYRLSGGAAALAGVAAVVFAATPFSYEAVAYVASLTHPLHVFWLLAALLLFDHGREVGSNRWLFLSGVALVAGLLSHENGLFIWPAMVGLDMVARPRAAARERARTLLPFLVPTIAYALLWLAIPKNSQEGLNTVADVGRNFVPFLQTLVYPILPLLRLEAGDVGWLVAAAVVVVAGSGVLARYSGFFRLWVFALGWISLSALPALLFLSPSYVYGSPRLSYLPSIGVALLWALPVVAVALPANERNGQPGGRRLLTGLGLVLLYSLALVVPAFPFIQCQLDFYGETSRMAREMAAAATQAPDGRDVVVVNVPFFFSSFAGQPNGCPNPYPWTPVGGILIPPYAQPRDFVRFNGGSDRPVDGVSFSGYAPGWRTFGQEIAPDELRVAVVTDSVLVFELWPGRLVDLGAVWQPGTGTEKALADFAGALRLTGAAADVDNGQYAVDLSWQVTAMTETPLKAFVHIYDVAGVLVAQSDSPPGDGLVPQSLWQTGDGLRDRRLIDVEGLPPGQYTTAVGVYSALDGGRLAATAVGVPLVDNVFVIGQFER